MTVTSIAFATREAPELGRGGREYELGCPHGTTRAVALPDAVEFTDAEVARLMLLRHRLQKRCGCPA
jgi:hypothetical protein